MLTFADAAAVSGAGCAEELSLSVDVLRDLAPVPGRAAVTGACEVAAGAGVGITAPYVLITSCTRGWFHACGVVAESGCNQQYNHWYLISYAKKSNLIKHIGCVDIPMAARS